MSKNERNKDRTVAVNGVVGVYHPYDPIGPDGKAVVSLSYRNVLGGGESRWGYASEGNKSHFVKPVQVDEYPLNTSYTWAGKDMKTSNLLK